jgi:hypothetical protein
MRHRALFPAAALAGALALPASSAPSTLARTQLYLDVATQVMPGVPDLSQMGALGGLAARMSGADLDSVHYGETQMPGAPGQYLDIALRNTLAPGRPAADRIPAGLRLGSELSLIPPVEGPGRAALHGDDKMPEAKARILIYWGCGRTVRPGQPSVFSVEAANGKVTWRGALEGRYAPDRTVKVGTSDALWPNPSQHKRVPTGSSLAGEHHITGQGVPDTLKFILGEQHDFMPKLALSASGTLQDGQTWQWQPQPRAQAYFLHATGVKGNDLILWSSSETSDAGMGVLDYLPASTLQAWVKQKVLLPTSATHCDVPAGIFGASEAGDPNAMGMLRMIAYGPESSIVYPPKPADPKAPWTPEWSVRVRTKSTAMALMGMDLSAINAAADAEPEQDQAPAREAQPGVKQLLKGLWGK